MQGVKILNKVDVMTCHDIWVYLMMVFFFGFMLFSIIGIITSNALIFKIYAICGIFTIISACVSVVDNSVYDYTKYQVTISDEVNFNEFSEKYEILDQDDKIYTVKEREEDNE